MKFGELEERELFERKIQAEALERKAKLDAKKRIAAARDYLNIPITPTQLERLDSKPTDALEAEARRLEVRVLNFKSAWAKDNRKALARIMHLRERMGQPLGEYEREQLLNLPKADVLNILKMTERAKTDDEDERGVPIASWRVERDFASPELLARNGVRRPRVPKTAVKLTIEEMRTLSVDS